MLTTVDRLVLTPCFARADLTSRTCAYQTSLFRVTVFTPEEEECLTKHNYLFRLSTEAAFQTPMMQTHPSRGARASPRVYVGSIEGR